MKKRVIANLVLAATLALSLVSPIYAAAGDDSNPAGDANVTIEGSGQVFEAYKLLDMTTSLKNPECHPDGDHGKDCWNAAYTVNGKYRGALQSVVGETATDREIVKYISDLTSDSVRTFADSVYGKIKDLGSDEQTSDKTFHMEQGYYLIAETTSAEDPDSISLVMLDTAGHQNITIKTKEGVPTLKKEVQDSDVNGDGDWGESADADVGDEIPFRLTGTMPTNIDNYETYKYVFHDSMGDALEFISDSVVVTIDGVTIDSSKYTVKTSDFGDDCDVEIVFEDIKQVADVTDKTEVVVTYKATLLSTVVKSVGNSAKVEFTKDPYDVTGSGTSTTIPSDDSETEVYSYKVVVNKMDQDNVPLRGAEFEIQKQNADGEYESYANGTAVVDETGTVFTFNGLDAGSYKLIETKTPDGYNTADSVFFEITAKHDKDELESLDAGADFTANLTDASLTTAVINSTGAILPSTGGSGTHALYAAGIVIILAGMVSLLVRGKKKTTTKED